MEHQASFVALEGGDPNRAGEVARVHVLRTDTVIADVLRARQAARCGAV